MLLMASPSRPLLWSQLWSQSWSQLWSQLWPLLWPLSRPLLWPLLWSLLWPLLLVSCSDSDRHIGGDWYLRKMPADSARRVDAHLDLLRESNGVRIVTASFIGSNFRFYPPNCVAFEWPPQETYREIRSACGNHDAARVAILSKRGVLMDADGLRPGLGVVMRPNSGITSAPGDMEPRQLITVANMRAAAERQPVNKRSLAPALTRMNQMMVWGIFLFIVLVALVIGLYRRPR